MRKSRGGFSLIEVTLAIGVIAFAFVSMMGLIPTGINVLHQAMDMTVGSAIIQRVMGDAQQADFSQLTDPTNSNTIRYFDDQGNDVSSGATIDPSAIYQVKTTIKSATSLPAGAQATAAQTDGLATVTIQIANNPGHLTIAADKLDSTLWKDSRVAISTYSGFVSKSK